MWAGSVLDDPIDKAASNALILPGNSRLVVLLLTRLFSLVSLSLLLFCCICSFIIIHHHYGFCSVSLFPSLATRLASDHCNSQNFGSTPQSNDHQSSPSLVSHYVSHFSEHACREDENLEDKPHGIHDYKSNNADCRLGNIFASFQSSSRRYQGKWRVWFRKGSRRLVPIVFVYLVLLVFVVVCWKDSILAN
mmetsp:Transcript_31265/g.75230  ORF Transcript_31265/g.75230 Transcript_31265/m.75230 type:complete len:192 (-) Transcript_31265:284-859(-)